jgi:hypothetical protein
MTLEQDRWRGIRDANLLCQDADRSGEGDCFDLKEIGDELDEGPLESTTELKIRS